MNQMINLNSEFWRNLDFDIIDVFNSIKIIFLNQNNHKENFLNVFVLIAMFARVKEGREVGMGSG